MLGNFEYCNPTKLYFGEQALDGLRKELPKYGKNILLVYGGGSIQKNGIYDQVVSILQECGKTIVEDAGVMPNPTVEKLKEGCERARAGKADFILAVGGGSVCDYAKAVSVSVHCPEDPWEKFYIREEEPENEIIPVGCVLTMVGTGSEMNAGSVITNHEQKLYQMIAGFFDIMSHILEQYFSGTDDNTSDYLMEGLLKSLIHSAKIAVENPKDYEARSNIMWIATWALNTLVEKGKTTDWEVHMIGQAVGAYTDATHGMTLSAVSLPYYRYILQAGLPKFKRYAVNVWDVCPDGKTDEQIAEEGLACMEAYMKQLGLVMNLTDLGVTEDMLEGIADATLIMTGGYQVLTHEDVVAILKQAL